MFQDIIKDPLFKLDQGNLIPFKLWGWSTLSFLSFLVFFSFFNLNLFILIGG